jgi:histidyl-tRNA synthetase
MFRKERPQKGRLRQFYHLGCEVIGSHDYALDIEIISLANELLASFGIKNYKIKINSLGCPKDRNTLIEILTKKLKPKLNKLCPDCQIRFKQNTLRILDCKEETCKEITKELNLGEEHLCQDCLGHFKSVKEGLDSLGIDYEVSYQLVRGLDYYTATVFEITHPNLGAQDALGAGGRYDNLVKELGGLSLGAIGFAFGMERLILAANTKEEKNIDKCPVYLISLGEKAKKYGMKLLNNLRKSEIICDTDYENKSLKGAMRKANDINAKIVLILGDDELEKNTITLKNMASGTQEEIKIEELIKKINLRLPQPKG